MKEKIIEIQNKLNDGKITLNESIDQILQLILSIDRFDIDGSKLSIKEQRELRMLFSTGNININIVL